MSARHYNERLREFIASGKVPPAAHEAEAYVNRKPEEAACAERNARRGPRRRTETTLDEMVAKSRTIIERVRPIVDRAIGRLRARFSHK